MSYSKTRWGYPLKAVIKVKTGQHFQWILHVVMVINSNYEVLVEYIVKPWPGQQGPLMHRFDRGNFVFKSCMGYLKQNVWIKLENNFNEGVWSLIMAIATNACWVGHFCIKLGFFVPNHVLCCQTGLFLSNECYNTRHREICRLCLVPKPELPF